MLGTFRGAFTVLEASLPLPHWATLWHRYKAWVLRVRRQKRSKGLGYLPELRGQHSFYLPPKCHTDLSNARDTFRIFSSTIWVQAWCCACDLERVTLWASFPCYCCWVASVVSDSVQPHRRQPTRLLCPWDSPGKNTRVGCHFLLPSSVKEGIINQGFVYFSKYTRVERIVSWIPMSPSPSFNKYGHLVSLVSLTRFFLTCGVLLHGVVAVGVFWKREVELADLGTMKLNLFPAGRVLIAIRWNSLWWFIIPLVTEHHRRGRGRGLIFWEAWWGVVQTDFLFLKRFPPSVWFYWNFSE